jgi:hypothetical protein
MAGNQQQHRQPMQLDRSASAGVAMASLFASLIVSVMLAGLPVWISATVFLFAILLVFKRVLICVVAIFILCVGYKLFFAWRYSIAQPGFTMTDVIFAFSLVTFIASSLRYVELDPIRFRWRSVGHDKREGVATEQIGSSKASLRRISSSLLRIPIALLLALALLTMLPEEVLWPNRFGFDPAVFRTVILVWLFIVALIIPASVVSLVKWRRLQTSQAGIYLRRALADEARREHKLIERTRYRKQQRLSSRQKVKNVANSS